MKPFAVNASILGKPVKPSSPIFWTAISVIMVMAGPGHLSALAEDRQADPYSADADEKLECKSVDLRVPGSYSNSAGVNQDWMVNMLRTPWHQGNQGWCYGFAAAIQASALLGKRVSPGDIALRFNKLDLEIQKIQKLNPGSPRVHFGPGNGFNLPAEYCLENQAKFPTCYAAAKQWNKRLRSRGGSSGFGAEGGYTDIALDLALSEDLGGVCVHDEFKTGEDWAKAQPWLNMGAGDPDIDGAIQHIEKFRTALESSLGYDQDGLPKKSNSGAGGAKVKTYNFKTTEAVIETEGRIQSEIARGLSMDGPIRKGYAAIRAFFPTVSELDVREALSLSLQHSVDTEKTYGKDVNNADRSLKFVDHIRNRVCQNPARPSSKTAIKTQGMMKLSKLDPSDRRPLSDGDYPSQVLKGVGHSLDSGIPVAVAVDANLIVTHDKPAGHAMVIDAQKKGAGGKCYYRLKNFWGDCKDWAKATLRGPSGQGSPCEGDSIWISESDLRTPKNMYLRSISMPMLEPKREKESRANGRKLIPAEGRGQGTITSD